VNESKEAHNRRRRAEGKGVTALSGQVRDSPVPLLRFIDLREWHALRTARAVRFNYRQRHPSLTSGPYHAKTARRARTRDHYGAATEGPRRPVTSVPHVAHYEHGCVA
jgi:hypothetical protein